MKCPNCQFENPEDAIFCNGCGKKLELECPKCGKTNPPGSRFCNKCGFQVVAPVEPTPKELSFDEKLEKIQRYLPKGLTEKILSQRDRIEGERKQVTVMFCDMEGFTALSEQIGPEEAYSIMDQVYEILIHKVHDFEGTVNEMTGDGIVALFGAPLALEDAPQRAIRSALAIHREIAKFSDRGREKRQFQPVKMRIGIHTGPVIVGTVGNDLRVEFKAVGDTVNLASRMEKLAQPGTTYVAEDTFKLTEGLFRFEGLGDREIKGKEKPVKVYRVLAPSTSRTRFDVSSERGLTPFVGRERELELLLDGFERVKEGRGQAFSIVAEAGLGKSRLLYEFRKTIANENVTFLEGKCFSYSRNVPYHPVIDILKSSFRIRESDGDIDIKDKIKKGLKIIGADEASALPYLLDLLSVKDSDIDEIPMSPDEKKVRIIEALNRNVLKGSEVRPVVMAIEDLHWIDKSSEERFKSLLDNIPGARVCLIFTYRPEFVHTWGGRSYHSQVTLNRLSNRESLAMVAYLLGTQEIDRDLEELVLEKTEGVPFFIEEFIRSLEGLRIIEKKNNTYHLSKDIQNLPIPATIQDVIMARVDSLPDEVKGVLQIGSVIGREFDCDLIKKLISLSDVELLSHMSALKDSELLYERGIFPQSTYIFKHALTQEVVYDSILTKKRKEIHGRVGKAIENLYKERLEDFYEMLALHYTEAGFSKEAIDYWQRAGGRATERSANLEAISHLTKGIELLATLPDTSERIQQELDLQMTLGPVLMATKGQASPEVERVYTRARDLCYQVGDTRQLFRVLCGLRRLYVHQAAFHTARMVAEQCFSLAQGQDDSAFLLEAHQGLGHVLCYLGEFAPARAHLEQALSFYNSQQHRKLAFSAGTDLGVHSLIFAARILWFLGYPDQALQRIDEALILARKLSHPLSLAWALYFASTIHKWRREVQAVQDQAEAAMALSTEHGFAYYLANGTIMWGWALSAQGQGEEGIVQLREGLAAYQATGAKNALPYWFVLLAEAYGHVAQPDDGLTVLAEALALVDTTGECYCEAELYRLMGDLLLKQAAPDESQADTYFHQALDIARRQQAKSIELRASMSLSRLWQSQGKKEKARGLLSEIYGWFTEGFDTADLKDAKALLDELS